MKSQDKKKASPERSRRVFVGLSGGVDSAVSAALLKKEGYDVTGVFIKAWNPPGFVCTWKEDRRSAMRAAAVLDIPFVTLDLENEYKKEVVDYMIDEYKKGRTPNPDVMCNKEIKFGHFLKFALKNGADFVATGHYARVSHTTLSRKASLTKVLGSPVARLNQTFAENFSGQLLEGADKNKDQSYFLWTLTQDHLKHTLFPIGHLQKSEVRKLADKFGLPQATRKDSQGLCFLGKIDMKEFLSHYIESKKGDVLNIQGEVIGEHNGAIFFTLGERHGFKITKKTSDDRPMYVVGKDIERNTIVVTSDFPSKTISRKVLGSPRPALYTHPQARPDIFSRQFSQKIFKLQNLNLNSEIRNEKLSCRYRYRQEKISCELNGDVVIFKEPQPTAAPGQSIVFYDGEKCLGGGIIK